MTVISRNIAIGIALLTSILAVRAVARPSGLTPAEECTESMMEAQGQYAYLLAYLYGPTNTINFTSNVDVTNMTYSFSADAGSVYGAQPFTLSASGSFNTGTNQWDMGSSGSIGATIWSSTGNGVDPPAFLNFESEFDPFLYTTTSEVTYTQTASQTISEGTITIRSTLTNDIVRKTLRHNVRTAAGVGQEQWVWYIDSMIGADGKEIKEQTNGDSPAEGGVGQFSMQVVETPEPSTGLLAIGIALIARRPKRA